MKLSIWCVALMTLCSPLLVAQPADDTLPKQVIIFARHGVRAPVLPNSVINNFSAQPFPVFTVATGNLTANGARNETLFGTWFRLWLRKEGLLTGNDQADPAFTYFRANGAPLITDTAKAFAAGMLPSATVNLNAYPVTANDPLFSPVAAGVAQLDSRMAIAAVSGRIGGDPQSLSVSFAPELALTRSILFNYPLSQTSVPPTPAGKIDVTSIPIALAAGTTASPLDLGGLADIIYAIDPFVMEYADGMPATDVGWGQLTATGISQVTRLYNLALDLEYRTPYLAAVQSSNMASHIVRSMVQAATGNAMSGSLGSPSTKVVVIMAANTNITGLAGLFHLDWSVSGYPQDVSAPGGALVFQLRQSQSTGEYIVRTTYVTQTMDQLRNRTILTQDAPPAIAPVFVPGCSLRNATFDCPLAAFVALSRRTIDAQSVDLEN
jgi:4-phytase/acid phosphatase